MATAEMAPWRFTVDEYYKMADAGIFHEDDRVELIDGEIVAMCPIGGPHMWCVTAFNHLLVRQVPEGMWVSVQSPVELGIRMEPQPDIAVVRKRDGARNPTTDDVVVLVEVADTSLTYDRRIKLPLYARAGIPEVWLADLVTNGLERHTDPVDGVYRTVARAGRGESLASLALPGFVVAVDEVLG